MNSQSCSFVNGHSSMCVLSSIDGIDGRAPPCILWTMRSTLYRPKILQVVTLWTTPMALASDSACAPQGHQLSPLSQGLNCPPLSPTNRQSVDPLALVFLSPAGCCVPIVQVGGGPTHNATANLYQLALGIGLVGGDDPGCSILQLAAASWVTEALAIAGGNLSSAIKSIHDTIAQGSLHITTTDDDLVIWSRSEAHTPTRFLSVPLVFLEQTAVGTVLRRLVELGAWQEVIRSLAYTNNFPRCRRPTQWMRNGMRSFSNQAKSKTMEAVEITLRFVAGKNPKISRDVQRWIKASGWRREENGGKKEGGEEKKNKHCRGGRIRL